MRPSGVLGPPGPLTVYAILRLPSAPAGEEVGLLFPLPLLALANAIVWFAIAQGIPGEAPEWRFDGLYTSGRFSPSWLPSPLSLPFT